MKFNSYFKIFAIVLSLLFFTANRTAAQTRNFPAPREEKLLNGTKLLVWNDPTASKVTVKIRIHSGSAFDPKDREGVMQLLSDILFPNQSTREFFAEDLNGSFEIVTNYDYIQINTTGDTDKFLTIFETLGPALTNPQITKETTQTVRAALLARVTELEKNPAYLADRAVAKRLFGNFPYGRPQLGSSESLSKIDFADLLSAGQKFMTADNATIAVSGNVKPEFVLRAAKRIFGGWLKGDKKVPSTFAQPEMPPAKLQILDSGIDNTSELRFAIRSVARNDKDFYAAKIIEQILQNRLTMREGANSFIQQNNNFLPGFIVLGVSNWMVGTVKRSGNTITLPVGFDSYQNNFIKEAVKPEEFDKARNFLNNRMNQTDSLDYWLDSQTYNLGSVKADWQNFQNVSLADSQKFLEKLQKEPAAAVLLLSAEKPVDSAASKQ